MTFLPFALIKRNCCPSSGRDPQRRRLPPSNSPSASPRPLSASASGRAVKGPALFVVSEFDSLGLCCCHLRPNPAGFLAKAHSLLKAGSDGAWVVGRFKLVDVLYHGGGPYPRQLCQIRPQPGVSRHLSFLLSLFLSTPSVITYKLRSLWHFGFVLIQISLDLTNF